MILERISSPKDMKKLDHKEIHTLVDEARNALLYRISSYGGHFGSNFGLVEATVALHYVFDAPKDKIVFDVSHQSYVHKILTGRKEAYLCKDKFHNVSGYTNPDESEYDLFNIGHTSTSISLACGLAKARDLIGNSENVIAVIGDGSLSGGEAFEGLNAGAALKSNLIIIVNDNQMSIAEDYGSLYDNLTLLRRTKGKAECNFFKAMGFDYVYVEDGNDVDALINTFQNIKGIQHPIVIHICTIKGYGYELAIENKEDYHWRHPFDTQTGKSFNTYTGENYDIILRDLLLNKMKQDKRVVAIAAGVPRTMAFTEDIRKQAGKQFIDVGIAEATAVTVAGGIAKNGGKPVFTTDSTFYQRAHDQIAQEVCINNLPVTLLVRNASVWGMNDVTHLGIFDMQMLGNIPNLVYLAPTNAEEYIAMLDWSIDQNQFPVAIRIPKNGVHHTMEKIDAIYGQEARYKATVCGEKIAVLALGDFYQMGEEVISLLKKECNINGTLINPRYITGLDVEYLKHLKEKHQIIITLEDGALDGGFGQKIASFYGMDGIKVMNYGLKNIFIDRYVAADVLEDNHLTPKQIVNDVKKALE